MTCKNSDWMPLCTSTKKRLISGWWGYWKSNISGGAIKNTFLGGTPSGTFFWNSPKSKTKKLPTYPNFNITLSLLFVLLLCVPANSYGHSGSPSVIVGSNSRPLNLQSDSYLLPDTLPTALCGPVADDLCKQIGFTSGSKLFTIKGDKTEWKTTQHAKSWDKYVDEMKWRTNLGKYNFCSLYIWAVSRPCRWRRWQCLITQLTLFLSQIMHWFGNWRPSTTDYTQTTSVISVYIAKLNRPTKFD